MPLNVRRLRLVFAVAAVLLLAVIAGFYSYARMRMRAALRELPQKLGVEIQQTAQGFTLCKSDRGRTLFCVHASKTIQYKQGSKAELQDVNITVYGRQGKRFDQIYGKSFEYDPQAGTIAARGEVHIDLQASTGNSENARPDQAPPEELKNPIHVKTSSLVFNQKTGMAETREALEFRTPQASGVAQGARYDSKESTLTLESGIVLHMTGERKGDIEARHGVVTKEPLLARFDDVHGASDRGNFAAGELRVWFRDDTTVERAIASGGVRGERNSGAKPAKFQAQQAEVFVSAKNEVHNAVLTGNVMVDMAGARALYGQAQRVLIDFGPKNTVQHVHALQNVAFTQQPGTGAERAIRTPASARAADGASNQVLQFTTAEGVEADVENGRRLQHAWSTSAAQIVITQPESAAAARATPASASSTTGTSTTVTTVTAGRFDATFDRQNRLQVLHGTPDAKIVSSSPGQADRVTTSHELDVTFNPNGSGIAAMQQRGDFEYREGTRQATAAQARFNVADEIFVLTGVLTAGGPATPPRYSDAGLAISANTLRMNRRSAEVTAEGAVKTTYTESRQQPGGAMLAGGSPIHVTAEHMISRTPPVADRRSAGVAGPGGTAVFSGGARLWQDANIVEAPTIEFNRELRTMLATAAGPQHVSTVFTQPDKNGKPTPVNVLSTRLSYDDAARRARFEGGVTVRGADATVTSDSVDVLLQARAAAPSPPAATAPQMVQGSPAVLERIISRGHVVIQEPKRRATGELLTYTAVDGKFVLTGSESAPPSIFDAERGTITGHSLTFFSRDDKVLVESSNSGPVPQTRVSK